MHSTIMTSDYIVFKFNVTITICSSILGAIIYGSFSVLTYLLKIPYLQMDHIDEEAQRQKEEIIYLFKISISNQMN